MQPLILVMFWAQNRCIWCQFEFRDGQDKIVASRLRFILDSVDKPPEVEALGEFVYSSNGVVFQEKAKVEGRAVQEKTIHFHGFHDTENARRSTYHNIKKVICAHSTCQKLVTTQGMAPFDRLRVKGLAFHLSQPLVHSFPVPPFPFPPPAQEVRRRANYILSELAKNLQRQVSGRLPFELWLQVGAHLLHECAALTALERVRAKAREKADRPMILDLSGSRSVYASYVKIDGKPYVKMLHHNVPPAVCPEGVVTVPLYRAQGHAWRRPMPSSKTAQSTRGGLHLFLAHDQVGIRQAFLVSVTDIDKFWDRRPDIPEVWWRHIRLGVGNISPSITIKTSLLDTLLVPPQKLRDTLFMSLAKYTDKGRPTIQVPPTFHHSWDPLPRRPIFLIELPRGRWEKSSSSYSNILMSSFECNAPNTIGYSALFDFRNLIGVVVHKTGDDLKMVRQKFSDMETAAVSTFSPAPPYWVYIPIDKGEYIVNILCRRLIADEDSFHEKSICSMGFSTNKGRMVEFGSAEHDWTRARLGCAARLDAPFTGKTVLVWYNRCDARPNRCGSQLLAFEQGRTSYLMDTYWGGPGDGPPVPARPEMLPGMLGPTVSWDGMDRPPNYLFETPELKKRNQRLLAVSGISRYSECSLRGVREIEVAFDDNFFGDRIVTGLLLRYADGRQEAVGSFRPDRVDAARGAIKVGPGDYLSFRFVGDQVVDSPKGVCRWVGNVSCHEYFPGKSVISATGSDIPCEDGQGDGSTLNVELKGTLAWCVFGWRDRVKWFPGVETRLGKRLSR